MQTINWCADMALGVPAMDAAHQEMLGELARLAEAPDERFGAGFGALTAAVERDFSEEEAQMESIAFPGLRNHREQHARVLSALHHADSQVQEGDFASAREAIALLPQWFIQHQATMDLALALALKVA